MRTPGKRIRQACEVLEKFGPMGASSLCDHIPDVQPSNMGKYCSRAVGLGLMTVERGLRNRSNYSIYTVVPNWKEFAEKNQTTRQSVDQVGTQLGEPMTVSVDPDGAMAIKYGRIVQIEIHVPEKGADFV